MSKHIYWAMCCMLLLWASAGCAVASEDPDDLQYNLALEGADAPLEDLDKFEIDAAQSLVCKETAGEPVCEAQQPLTPLGIVCVFAANAIAIGACQYLSAQCEGNNYAVMGRGEIPCWVIRWLGCTSAGTADIIASARCLLL